MNSLFFCVLTGYAGVRQSDSQGTTTEKLAEMEKSIIFTRITSVIISVFARHIFFPLRITNGS